MLTFIRTLSCSHPKRVYRRMASLVKSLQYLCDSRVAADPKDKDGGQGQGSWRFEQR